MIYWLHSRLLLFSIYVFALVLKDTKIIIIIKNYYFKQVVIVFLVPI